MKFKGSSVRTLTRLLAFTKNHPRIRLAFNTKGAGPSVWTRLGFNETLEDGQCTLPSCVGRASAFNARGKEIVRKDLPKETRHFMSWRTWQDWHGYEHSGIQNRSMECYPREYVAAPSEVLYALLTGDDMHITSRQIDTSKEDEASLLHLANLMLDCFGEFDVLDADTAVKIGAKVKRLQWEILPAGSYPWEKTRPFVQKFTQRLDKPEQDIIEYRIAHITQYKPEALSVGTGGFDGYFVFGFEKKKVFVLESGHLDNATYVFKDDWERFSQLTKNEIINGDIPHTRIVHDYHWNGNLSRVLRS